MKQTTGLDPEVIRGRRQLIRDDAPCIGCGGRWADCLAARGKDPAAPPWFGCCARGTGMVRCVHRPSADDLTALLKEIESGTVRPAEEILAERAARAQKRQARITTWTTPEGRVLNTVTAMLGQGEWWRQRSGQWIRVADMSPGHRYNTAAMVLRDAKKYATAIAAEMITYAAGHDGGDVAHSVLERMAAEAGYDAICDPQKPIRESVLYRALTVGLTVQVDGTAAWQKNGRDPVTGEVCEVPPPLTKVCELPACGCSGEAHA